MKAQHAHDDQGVLMASALHLCDHLDGGDIIRQALHCE
jgi:hypothetical protein